jgi:5-methylcytosine-specific restriction endonuclease McrA
MTRIPKSVRDQVRQRARGRCEYCGIPDVFAPHTYHVDHIISQKHRGSDEIVNLAWACFRCNTNKGTDIAAYDSQAGTLEPLYNPRTQEWDNHFRLDGVTIVGITPIGRATLILLDMNHPAQVEARTELVEAGLW